MNKAARHQHMYSPSSSLPLPLPSAHSCAAHSTHPLTDRSPRRREAARPVSLGRSQPCCCTRGAGHNTQNARRECEGESQNRRLVVAGSCQNIGMIKACLPACMREVRPPIRPRLFVLREKDTTAVQPYTIQQHQIHACFSCFSPPKKKKEKKIRVHIAPGTKRPTDR